MTVTHITAVCMHGLLILLWEHTDKGLTEVLSQNRPHFVPGPDITTVPAQPLGCGMVTAQAW
jgi:hypothetical protein